MLKKGIYLDILVICILGIAILGMSYKILPNIGGISYNDSAYFWNLQEKKDSIISAYSSDYGGTSLLNGIFLYAPKWILIYIFKIFGLNDFWISYLLSFGWVFITAIVGYFILSKISQSRIYWFLGTLLLLYNNIAIEYLAFGQYSYYSYTLAILLLLNTFLKVYQNWWMISCSDILKIGLFSLLVILPINLVGYGILILSLYLFLLVEFWYKKKYVVSLILVGISILILNIYWMLPFFIWLGTTNSWAIYSGNADWVLQGFSKMATHINILSFRQYFNTISDQLFDSPFVSIGYVGLLAILTYSFGFVRKVKERSMIIFLFVLYLIFFHLSLWPNSIITWDSFRYLWENYSFFHFFRSFTRFSIPTFCILLVILALYFRILKNSKIQGIISILLIPIILGLHYPLLTGNMKDILVAIRIPNEYSTLNARVKNNETIISYPNPAYETYSWSVGKSDIQVEDYFLKEYIVDSPILYDRASINLKNRLWFYSEVFWDNPLKDTLIETLRENSIEYVLVQKKLINVFNKSSVEYRLYREFFLRNSEKILDNREFSLFYIWKWKKKLYSENWYAMTFQRNASYGFSFTTHLPQSSTISFLENFHLWWKLYLEQYTSLDCTENGKIYNWTLSWESNIWTGRYHVTECPSKNQFYAGWELAKLWKKPIFDYTHTIIYDYANQWTIDPEYIKKHYSREYYKENPDGSIDVRMTLYFQPQSYFYLGLIISGSMLILFMGYIWYDSYRRKKLLK